MKSNHPKNQRTIAPKGLLAFSLAGITCLISSIIFADVPGSVTLTNQAGFTVNRHYDAHYNGATINLWEKNHHSSQDWFWNDGTIRSATNPNYCLNIHNYSLHDGAIINLWQCNGHDSQKWVLVNNTIRPTKNWGFCLNLHNYDNNNGATINLWRCNGHPSQYWRPSGQMTVSLSGESDSQFASTEFELCATGSGFTPNGDILVTVDHPAYREPQAVYGTTADAYGNFVASTYSAWLLFPRVRLCDWNQYQAESHVYFTDLASGVVIEAPQDIPKCWFCQNVTPRGGGTSFSPTCAIHLNGGCD